MAMSPIGLVKIDFMYIGNAARWNGESTLLPAMAAANLSPQSNHHSNGREFGHYQNSSFPPLGVIARLCCCWL
jgi:hypothetical protein